MNRTLRVIGTAARWIAPCMAVVLIGLAIWVLRKQLQDYRYSDIIRQVQSTPVGSIALAVLLTIGAYALLIGYDALALAYIGKRLPFRKIALGSFVAHSMSHSLGFHMITAGSIRYRFWSAWGLSNTEIARALGFASTSFLFGMLLVCGAVLLFEPPDTMALLKLPTAPLRVLGAILVTGVAGFLLWMRFGARPTRLFGREIELPKARLAIGHLLIAASDWTVAASVAYVLLPAGHDVGLLHFTGIFLFALLTGAIGHVPGGVGVFETLVVLMLKPYIDPPAVLGSLILYRLIYYVLPFVAGLALMIGHEFSRHGLKVARAASRWVPVVMPFALGTAVFAAGTVVLLSSAVALNADRMIALSMILPLFVVESAHFAACILGMTLLVVAWFIQRRLFSAYKLATIALAGAAFASQLRGLVWEVAALCAIVLMLLLLSRPLFNRSEPLATQPIGAASSAGIVTVVVLTIWLGFFSFKNVGYTADMWLRSSFSNDAARFARGMAGSLLFLIGFGMHRISRRTRLLVAEEQEAGSG